MSYSISREDPIEARKDILRTWSESLPGLDERRLDWIYCENPAGRAGVWIARAEEDGRVIGSTAVLARAFVIDGSDYVGGIAADFSVSAEHRGFGPALALQRAVVQAADQGPLGFIYALPNRGAAAVLLRAGYKKIGAFVKLTLPLRTRGFVLRSTRSSVLAALLAPLGDLALRALGAVRALEGSARRFSGRELTDFDGRFDALWESVRARHPILGDRSARFLRWRFGQSPQVKHRIFGLFERHTDSLAGYVVYHTVDGRTFVDDLLCRDVTQAFDALLSAFARFQRREGVEAIVVGFFGDPEALDGLRRNHFRVRDEAMPFVLYVPPGSPISETVSSPENWWFLPADNDL